MLNSMSLIYETCGKNNFALLNCFFNYFTIYLVTVLTTSLMPILQFKTLFRLCDGAFMFVIIEVYLGVFFNL